MYAIYWQRYTYIYKFFLYILCIITFAIPYTARAAQGWDADTLVYAWSSNVGPLDAHAYGANKMFAQAFIYEPLVQYGQGGHIEPCLATAWHISTDGCVYTFNLRKDVLFSDGTPFTAAAVEKNFASIMQFRQRHDWLAIVNQIKSTRIIDTHTFELTLHQPYAAALQELSLVRPLRMLAPSAIQDGQCIQAIGTGPWILAESRKGEYDRFVRNEQYWGIKPHMRQIVVKVIPDAEARAVALENDIVDIVATAIADHGSAGVNPDAYAVLAAHKDIQAVTSAPRNTRLLALNTALFPTNDISVRRAIVQTIDRHAILKGILLGQELPAETLLAADIPHCNVPLHPYTVDPKAAAQILDKAGWLWHEGEPFRSKQGKTLRIELKFLANEQIMRSISEVIQSQLASIGIDVRIVGEEPTAFTNSQITGNFHMVFCESNGAPYDPFSYVAAMRVAGHADFQAQKGLKDKAKLDAAITEALSTRDTAHLDSLFHTILTILHDEIVYIPLSRTVDKALFKKNAVGGFAFTPVSYELPFNKIYRP